MSARQDGSAQGRGSTDAGRPAGPAPRPAQAAGAATEDDGSAWDDGADDGAAAWDHAPSGDASAWDDDAPAPVSTWDAAPATASVWDEHAPAPASTWDEVPSSGAAETDGDPAPVRRPARRTASSRPMAARTTSDRSASSRPDTAADAGSVPDAVAAVAARLAEIAGRPGADPAPGGDGVEPTDIPSRRSGAGSSARRSGSAGRPGGRRRTGGGRGRAPATEPPEDGPAAVDAEPDHESVARTVALRLLTGAPKSRHQLAEAMARRDVPEDVADRVLDRFTEVGLVDDAAYAEILVRSRHTERGLSRRALAQELRRRGVDDETAQEALEQVDDADEEVAARALARKKLRATRGLDREVRLRRAYGALGRRGYGGSLVSRVVREELDAEGADDDEAGSRWSGGFGGG